MKFYVRIKKTGKLFRKVFVVEIKEIGSQLWITKGTFLEKFYNFALLSFPLL